MSRVKTYKKHVIERSVGGKSVEKNEDGTPKLGKCLKENVRITPELAETLNHGWDSTQKPISFYWILDEVSTEKDAAKQKLKEAKSKTSAKTLQDANNELLLAEIENKKLKLQEENKKINTGGSKKANDIHGEKESTPKPLKKALVEECESEGLDTSGNVKVLTERLANHKA